MSRFSRFRARPHRQRERLTRPRIVAISGLTLLALATAILVVIAMSQRSVEPTSLASAETPNTEPMTAEPLTPEPTTPPSDSIPAADPSPEALVAPTRQLTVGSEPGTLLRATIGTCGVEPGLIEASFDDGDSWRAGGINDLDGNAVWQLGAGDGGVDRFVYLNEECAPAFAQSFVSGIDWELTNTSGNLWFLPEAGAPTVVTPVGEVSLPCTPVAVSALNDRGIVLCENASVSVSQDAGASWSDPQVVPAAVAVGVAEDTFVIASANEASCAGVTTRALTDSALSGPGNCAEVLVDPGAVAVTGVGGHWFLWAGDNFLSTNDRGGSWA